jgi:CBS-domain-containing membrane protein
MSLIKSGTGGVLGIAFAGGLATLTGLPFLLAPFGASAVLLFGQPNSPFAQPINTIGGYLISTLVGLGLLLILPSTWWVAALAVGIAIMLMLVLRVTHPPAGAIPIVAATSHLGQGTLVGVVLGGSIALVGLAVLHHRIPPRHDYPKPVG